MDQPYTSALLIIGGVNIGIGVIHAFIGARAGGGYRRASNLWFGLSALAYAMSLGSAPGVALADGAAQYVASMRWAISWIVVHLALLYAFVAAYGRRRIGWFGWAVGATAATVLLANLTTEHGLLYGGPGRLELQELPWGTQVHVMVADASRWSAVLAALIAGIAPYAWRVARSHPRAPLRRRTRLVAAVVSGYALALLYDLAGLVGSGQAWFVTDIGHLLLLVLLSLELCDDVALAQRTRERLAESESRVRALIENSPSVIFVKDLDGRYAIANRRFTELVGDRGVLGKRDEQLFSAERARQFQRNDAEIEAGGAPLRFEEDAETSEGLRTFMTVKFAVRDDNGAVCGVGGIATDITERKQAEAALLASRDDLEQRVQDRTAALESFTYSVSHDLRAPVRQADAYAAMLLEDHGDQLDEEARRKAELIRGAVARMSELIRRLLELAQLDRQPLRVEPVSCDPLVREVWDELSHSHDVSRVEFTCDPLPEVTADPELLRVVWRNLLDNAVKYSSGQDVPAVRVRCERCDEQLWFAVQDNGVGFDPAYADKLFGLFQRLHDSAEFPGVGVGLALAKRIVERHGGAIVGTGEAGGGATLRFHLS